MTYSFTINTDASHDPTTRTAGWDCWIKSTHYKIQDSGLFPEPVPNSSVAELMAIEQALLRLDNLIWSQDFLRDQMTGSGIILYINTDSKWSIMALQGQVKRSKHLAIARRIRSLTEGYIIDPRHVKSHTRKKDARSVNDWCDKAAKRHVRRRLKEINDRSKQEI